MKSICCVIVMSLLLAGCAGPIIVLPPAPAAEILVKKLVDTGARWQQLDAAAKVGIDQQGKYMSTQQFVLLEKPDQLRLDVLTLFNQLALQLAVGQGELQVLVNTTVPGQYYRGPVSDELLARFTRLPLGVDELVRLLLYDPPVPTYRSAIATVEGDRYLLHLIDGQQQQQFFFDEQLQLRRALYLSGGAPLLSIDYDQLDKDDAFPRRIQLEMPRQQTTVTVNLSEVLLNQPAKAGRFQLSFPANATPLQLSGLSHPGEEQ